MFLSFLEALNRVNPVICTCGKVCMKNIKYQWLEQCKVFYLGITPGYLQPFRHLVLSWIAACCAILFCIQKALARAEPAYAQALCLTCAPCEGLWFKVWSEFWLPLVICGGRGLSASLVCCSVILLVCCLKAGTSDPKLVRLVIAAWLSGGRGVSACLVCCHDFVAIGFIFGFLIQSSADCGGSEQWPETKGSAIVWGTF